MVNIRDHYVPADFMVLGMGDEDKVHLILGRPFLNTTSALHEIRRDPLPISYREGTLLLQ
jgi:hypothetical protein